MLVKSHCVLNYTEIVTLPAITVTVISTVIIIMERLC